MTARARAPPGYIFFPPEHVLVREFLNRKLRGERLWFEGCVSDIERHHLYCQKPWDLFAKHAELPHHRFIYFFTTATDKNNANTSSGNIVERNNGNGGCGDLWIVENNGASFPVEDPDNGNQVVGYKKTFLYDDSDQDDIEYEMTEYSSLQPPKVPFLDYVVCQLEKMTVYDVGRRDGEEAALVFSDDEIVTEDRDTAAAAAAA
ncbi:hypothetical protein LguiB_026789 [Lonicera macranthoides]